MLSHSHTLATSPPAAAPVLRAVSGSPPADPLIGRRLGGRYTVERSIGRCSYLARQDQPPHEVMLEVLALRNDEAAARFDREAGRLGELRHPNVAAILDHGREAGTAYVVMEHLQGERLRDHLARHGRLELEAFVPIAAQILKGVGHAHTRELVVGELEPANIMLCERKGRANFVKLQNFCFSKLLVDDEPVTDEHVLGMVGYLAPEVINGEPIDLRADVYAIGVLFHHMLSGRLPFVGESASIFYDTLGAQAPTLPPQLGLPEGLVRLVHRCLAKHPDDRPADANAVVEELIDAVPAHLFRLPRARASAVPAGSGNTGMVELVGKAALSGPHEVVQREESVSLVLGDTGPIETPAPARAGRRAPLRLMSGAVLAGALMAVLGGAVAAMVFDGDVESTPATQSGSAHDDAAAATVGLDEARRLIDEGRLDLAGEVLDSVRNLVRDTPALQARLERTDRSLLVARLMNTAARFEGEDDVAAAVSAYRDVLAADPTHAVARSRLSRLTTGPATDDSAHGAISIDAHPDADLAIDGKLVGSTPYTGRLPVGTHTIRLTARGHQPWEGSIEIGDGDNDPIDVRLHAKSLPRTKPSARPGKPTPAPTPTPAAAAPRAEPQPARREVFLPRKPSEREGGVFLPTKE